MPHPGKVVARNSSYDGRWSAMDEDFIATLKELVPILLAPKNLNVKTVNGVTVKAFEIAVYIKQYIELFKSESLPEAKTIYDSTIDNQFQILLSKAVEVYLQSIQFYQNNITAKNEIESLHNISKSIAVKHFDDEKKFGNEQEVTKYREDLIDKLEKAYNEWKPITLEFLDSIKEEHAEAEKQKVLAEKAKASRENFENQAVTLERQYQELKARLDNAKLDTQESRREAEMLRKKLAQTDREHKEALDRAEMQRQQQEELHKRVSQLERQLEYERQIASQRMQNRVREMKRNEGFLNFVLIPFSYAAAVLRKAASEMRKLFV